MIGGINLVTYLQSKIPEQPMLKIDAGSRFPIESFIMVSQDLVFYEVLCDDAGKNCLPTENIIRQSGGTGSGVIVGNKDGRSLVLTAGHVCSIQDQGIPVIENSSVQYRMDLESGFGRAGLGTIIAIDTPNDLCLMIADTNLGPALPIADEEPYLHEVIYNMASPFGLALPVAVPVFDGYFVGQVDTIFTFSLPAAPGSSGSPVMNENGEIISIISGAAVNFDEFAIGCTTSSIRNFVLAVEASL
tara:strand:+ start:6010 stop:6744 length:735 start_codon:yes stop_codon:yes gene_type:complete